MFGISSALEEKAEKGFETVRIHFADFLLFPAKLFSRLS